MSRSLADRILEGEVRAASRLMRWVEDGRPEARAELDALFPHTGNAAIVGFTGQPGSGKSTLVNGFIEVCRDRDLSVGCLAIDPSSPFTGGAILGDRVRMNAHALDEGVFIRSLATRGQIGGLSRSTPAAVQVMDAMGFDIVIIETVGVGQDEIDIVQLADTIAVLMVPGLGDDIQAAKAGILEIADMFVVNKADLDGADQLVRELQTMLNHAGSEDEDTRTPPILRTIATQQDGLDTLFDEIQDHLEWLDANISRRERERNRFEQLVRLVATGEFNARLDDLMDTPAWDTNLEAVLDREQSPYAAADVLLDDLF